jgi:hypothetical protein
LSVSKVRIISGAVVHTWSYKLNKAGRRTERASLEKKPSIRLSQEPCVGGGEPSFRLLGDVRGMIVEDQFDRGMGRIGGIEKLD